MNWNRIYLVGLIISVALSIFAQNDNAVYKEKKDGFYQNTIQKEIKEFENRNQDTNPETYLSIDFEGKDYPVNTSCIILQYDKGQQVPAGVLDRFPF